MSKRRACLAALLACSSQLATIAVAQAAPDEKLARPSIAPPPNWVLPAAIPQAPAAAEGAATVDLLNDTQVRLSNSGDSSYHDIAYKIASAEGLGDAPLQLTWDPSLETLAIHRYRILRDGTALDLLGDGSRLSIIQRETNMESAALDGQLTATLQPEGVRVGDTIEIVFTRTRNDPVLGGRSQVLVGPNDGTPYGRLRVRYLWPDAKAVKWRAYAGVLQPKLTHGAGGNELTADVANVTTPVAPKGAPGRFRLVNAIEVSEFPDWGSVSATILPRYENAIKLGPQSRVRAEAERIGATTNDPKRRAELALQLVQEQIRYLYIGMNDGGYVPAAADLTWARRFGDCKGKAALLLALLRELKIDAEPVLVNTDNGDLVANRLPALSAFDHVIVRAHIRGRDYWLDGTRLGDTQLEQLHTPPYVVGLPLASGTRALLPLNPDPLVEPSETVSVALDASAGIEVPATVTGEMRFRGASAADMRMKYAGLSATDRENELRTLWHKNFDQISPTAMNAAVDPKTGDFLITVSGTAKLDWAEESGARWYEVDRSRLGWKFDTDRHGAISAEAPFAIDYPDYWESRETIKLPAGGTGFKLQGQAIDKTISGIYAFHRKVAIEGATVTMESSTRALAPELPAGKAEQTRAEMASLMNDGVFVRVPDGYMATSADIAALQGNKPALATAFLKRGAAHFDRNEFAESIADERAALAYAPDEPRAHAILALALAMHDDEGADTEADRALQLDTKQTLAWRAKAVVASAQKRYADAEKALDEQIKLGPKDPQPFVMRGSARLLEGNFTGSLADLDNALALAPEANLHLLRATALAGLGRKEDALAEADRGVNADPKSERALRARAELRANFGEQARAREDYDALIKLSPKADYYVERAVVRPAVESAEREADIDAALRLDPHSTRALAARATMAIERADYSRAQTAIDAIERADNESPFLVGLRVRLLTKEGRSHEALGVLNEFVAKHPADAVALNERCWTKATLGVELSTALSDCDASLKLQPNSPAVLDSRAFAKLRLGQIEGALADYDAALELEPGLPASLYGRAIARARHGDQTGAMVDLALARKLNPDIDARFADYGITLPSSLPSSPQAKYMPRETRSTPGASF